MAVLTVGRHGNVFQPGLCWLPWKRLPARALLVAVETSSSQGSAGHPGNILVKALLVAKETSSSQGFAALAVGLSQKSLQVTEALNE